MLYSATDISYLNILFRFLGTNISVFVTKIQYSPWPIMWNTNKHLVLAMLHVHKSKLSRMTRQIGNQNWNPQRRRFKSKLYDKRDDSTFPIVNSLSPIVISHHHQRMEFTFHNSYAILERVLSTVIFRKELSCLRKIYSNKATLLLDWSLRIKNSTVVITMSLTITN